MGRIRRVVIIGSTGSIGVNALKVIEAHPDRFRVEGLACATSVRALAKQILKFKPSKVYLKKKEDIERLKTLVPTCGLKFFWGDEGLEAISADSRADTIVFAVVGARGLMPLIAAVRAGKIIGFANKEPFVMAGTLIRKLAAKSGATLIPIDSELSAIYQCLKSDPTQMSSLILTSSGGPFRTWKRKSFARIQVSDALKHPRWKMGPKITIDSATLMNKGLEVIETSNYFGVPADRVRVVIHPEAVIHSMVEMKDGAVIAQLGVTDMRLPIQYALSYPERMEPLGFGRMDLSKLGPLHFEKPDCQKFPCLGLGYEAQSCGGTMPTVLNAANEVAVSDFLAEKIKFEQIPSRIEYAMGRHKNVSDPDVEAIIDADLWARQCI